MVWVLWSLLQGQVTKGKRGQGAHRGQDGCMTTEFQSLSTHHLSGASPTGRTPQAYILTVCEVGYRTVHASRLHLALSLEPGRQEMG